MAVTARKDSVIAELMTDREAAAYCRLKPKCGYLTMQRWAREGVIKAGSIGEGKKHQWLFRKRDLDDKIFPKK